MQAEKLQNIICVQMCTPILNPLDVAADRDAVAVAAPQQFHCFRSRFSLFIALAPFKCFIAIIIWWSAGECRAVAAMEFHSQICYYHTNAFRTRYISLMPYVVGAVARCRGGESLAPRPHHYRHDCNGSDCCCRRRCCSGATQRDRKRETKIANGIL